MPCLALGWTVLGSGEMRMRSTISTGLLLIWSSTLLPRELHYGVRGTLDSVKSSGCNNRVFYNFVIIGVFHQLIADHFIAQPSEFTRIC